MACNGPLNPTAKKVDESGQKVEISCDRNYIGGYMELAIIGATGKTGIWTLRKAVEAGHNVRAVVRNRGKLESQESELAKHEKVDIREADVTDAQAVRQALSGVETVIFAAGPVKDAPPDLLTRASDNIISSMKSEGGKKLVWLTGAGVMDSRDEKSFSRKLIRGLMKMTAGKVLKTSEGAYEKVKNSGLTYVVVRPPMLADEPGGKNLVASYTPPKAIPLGREDLGDFLVTAATTDKYNNESPLISYEERT
jgi:putative NADH-flavin reductase